MRHPLPELETYEGSFLGCSKGVTVFLAKVNRPFRNAPHHGRCFRQEVRFMLRDILELRKSKWVPRRQKDEAKKISEIHAAAHAELGMIPAAMMPGLAPLPAQVRAGVPGLGEDVELFPAFKTDGVFLCNVSCLSPPFRPPCPVQYILLR